MGANGLRQDGRGCNDSNFGSPTLHNNAMCNGGTALRVEDRLTAWAVEFTGCHTVPTTMNTEQHTRGLHPLKTDAACVWPDPCYWYSSSKVISADHPSVWLWAFHVSAHHLLSHPSFCAAFQKRRASEYLWYSLSALEALSSPKVCPKTNMVKREDLSTPAHKRAGP